MHMHTTYIVHVVTYTAYICTLSLSLSLSLTPLLDKLHDINVAGEGGRSVVKWTLTVLVVHAIGINGC